jgi:phage head maturation protease
VDTVYKTVPFELTELKASDGGGWSFTGYASTYGNVDAGGDVVMRGAFDASLGLRKKRPLLWQHDLREPIGVEV